MIFSILIHNKYIRIQGDTKSNNLKNNISSHIFVILETAITDHFTTLIQINTYEQNMLRIVFSEYKIITIIFNIFKKINLDSDNNTAAKLLRKLYQNV